MLKSVLCDNMILRQFANVEKKKTPNGLNIKDVDSI